MLFIINYFMIVTKSTMIGATKRSIIIHTEPKVLIDHYSASLTGKEVSKSGW